MQISSQGSPGSCRLVTFRPQGVAAASRDGTPRENDTILPSHGLSTSCLNYTSHFQEAVISFSERRS